MQYKRYNFKKRVTPNQDNGRKPSRRQLGMAVMGGFMLLAFAKGFFCGRVFGAMQKD